MCVSIHDVPTFAHVNISSSASGVFYPKRAAKQKFPLSFALNLEVFFVEMSTNQLLRCYNKSCGKEYKEDENGEGNDLSAKR